MNLKQELLWDGYTDRLTDRHIKITVVVRSGDIPKFVVVVVIVVVVVVVVFFFAVVVLVVLLVLFVVVTLMTELNKNCYQEPGVNESVYCMQGFVPGVVEWVEQHAFTCLRLHLHK